VDRLVCLGVSHRTAPVELRERFGTLGLGADRCPEVDEHAVLATCYRVELYAYLVDGVGEGRDVLIDELADAHGVDRSALTDHLYVHAGGDVARHLARVASGLDSLVLGEAEILGQVRGAFDEAQRSGTTGPVLELLFRSAVTTGRRVRSETAIGANPATASSMALSLAAGALGDLHERRALVVGAGRIALQTLKALSGRGVRQAAVANRSVERAREVASMFSAVTYSLDELSNALAWADLAVTATSSEVPVVSVQTVEAAMKERQERPLVLVDLAVPADVDRAVGAIAGVRLFDVDDLRAGLDEALASRLREVPKVEAIVEEEVADFGRRYRELDVEPLLAAFRRRAERIREAEVERTIRRLGDVDAGTVDQIERLSRSLVKKLLHEPTARLRELAREGAGGDAATAARELFGIDTPPDS
jgi:glutamyl-tRNA reductase